MGHVLGSLLMIFSLAYLLPILWSLFAQDGEVDEFLTAMLVNLAVGFGLWKATQRYKRDLKPRDGFLLVSLSWLFMGSMATIPLVLTIENLSFTDAFFETISGLSTTGATVLVGLDTLPPSVNLWRHELNWLGGMGIIVLAVAVLPLLGIGGMQLYKAETPGPMKDDKLTPRITQTAKSLWMTYLGLTIACMLALKFSGMNWLDAVCHAFATLALGGFSTHDASIGHFNSVAIECVIMVFMVLAAMNFSTHFLAWRQRKISLYWQDSEITAMLALLAVACVVLSGFVWWKGVFSSYWVALRHTSFNLISIATDCGFASFDYSLWPHFVGWCFLLLSCICACSGSTGGGIKMIRTLILFKQARREMFGLVHPNAVHALKIGGKVIPTKILFSVLGFLHLYTISVIGLSLLLVASGLDFETAVSAIIACINNAGPGLNVLGPAGNYQSLSNLQTWVCTFAMLLGRLEVFSLLILFTPGFWRA
jgi:trk system potassium uptake protein TrkH